MKITQKNLMNSFKNLNKKDALTIVKLVNGTLDPESLDVGYKRVMECYHRPSNQDLVLTCVNSILKGYGVESVPWKEDAIYDRDFISYVNFGDTYLATIVYNPESCKFLISSWVNLYEQSPDFNAKTKEEAV